MNMTPFWWANSLLWTAVFLRSLRGAWAAASGRNVRIGDPLHLTAASVSLMMAGFTYRWLFAPSNELLWQSLYLLSGANAVYLWTILQTYGRGRDVE